MRAEFLRHEYTWSKQSIGGKIGLGVTASSTPKEKEQLHEIEKMAAVAQEDTATGTDVDLLMYSPLAGFVKMSVVPVPVAEDQRKNKKVYSYQCASKEVMDPSIYSIPTGHWESIGKSYLPPMILEEEWMNRKDILIKYHLVDRLPDLFRAVFWCVFRGSNNLAFLTSWNRMDYTENAREIMYAIHSILPEDLRKNAGYASYGCGMNQCTSFYFTDQVSEADFFDVDSLEYHRNNQSEDHLDTFFYDTLAAIYWENEKLYDEFIEHMQTMIHEREINKNLLREVQWMFLPFCLQAGIDIPQIEDVRTLFPQLFYQASESELLTEIQDSILDYYHFAEWNIDDLMSYLSILENGFTKKGEQKILDEMEWIFASFGQEQKIRTKDYTEALKVTKNKIYTKFMTRFIEKEGSIAFENNQKAMSSLPAMKDYIDGMDADCIAEPAKEIWMYRGIDFLNQDVFVLEHYECMTEIAKKLNWNTQWTGVLHGFLQQLENGVKELEDDQLAIACQIEKIYEDITGKTENSALKEEKILREHGEIEMDLSDDMPKEEDNLEEEDKEKDSMGDSTGFNEDQVYRTIDKEEEKNKRGRFLPFLVDSIPYGFLTGCILYLLNYALVIGHWKISVGAAGMWVILMLNHMNERLHKKDGYRTWMSLGLCIVEGYIIETIAWVFLLQDLRVYFFLILGVITVLIQIIHMIILRVTRNKEEDML